MFARILLCIALIFTTCPVASGVVVSSPLALAPPAAKDGEATYDSSVESGLSAGRLVAAEYVEHEPRDAPLSQQSQDLTHYLKTHRLPLVGAQVSHDATGRRQVVLYGFVATPFGKTDAVKKARAFLKDPELLVENRIKIRPELRNMHGPSKPSEPPETTSPGSTASAEPLPPNIGSIQAYQNQGRAVQPNPQQQQQQPDWLTALLPLVGVAAAVAIGAAGGGVGVYPGYGYSYSSPYPNNPYP